MTDKAPKHGNIYAALVAAQGEMSAPVKGAVNPHFKSRYADLAAVMEAALPALNKHGIACWHSVVALDGAEYMRTTLSHGETDTHLHCDVRLIVSKQDMQGYKSATTYAKRIGVESVTGLAPEDDDGNAAAQAAPKAATRPAAKPDAKDAAQLERAIGNAIEGINECDTEQALRELWGLLNAGDKRVISDKRVVEAKDAMRDKLAAGASETPY